MTIRACLTGINEYLYNPDQNRLRGCGNDARNLAARFKCKYTMLLDSKAIKANIFAAWRETRDKCQPGDRLRLTQSSHGIPEGICCFDLNILNGDWNPAGYISYHEIAEFCAEIPESILTEILIDACHCEDQLKDLGRVYGKAKFMRTENDMPLLTTPVKVAQPTLVKSNVIYWAACEPNQTSADAYIDNQPQGAFTAAFLKFEQGHSRSDIIYYARDWLGKNGYGQRPHLYAGHELAMEKME